MCHQHSMVAFQIGAVLEGKDESLKLMGEAERRFPQALSYCRTIAKTAVRESLSLPSFLASSVAIASA
jgi:hypothetical protein